MNSAVVLEAVKLRKTFTQPVPLGVRLAGLLEGKSRLAGVQAVSDVSLEVRRGEVVGLVGESGCGKSTLGRMLSGVLSPSDGSLSYNGTAIENMSSQQRKVAALKVQMIFQNPFASLNPRRRIGETISEAPRVHGLVERGRLREWTDQTMLRVGLDPSFKERFPHQLSGGQRQRVGIARALAVDPEILVCDESVAALDVSIQAQILNLFLKLREEMNLTYVFISHDLSVVHHLSDRVAIMYLGRIVELAPTEELFSAPNHPYTQALLTQVKHVGDRRQAYTPIKGEIPSPMTPPSGCHFHPRCPFAMPKCRTQAPQLRAIAPAASRPVI